MEEELIKSIQQGLELTIENIRLAAIALYSANILAAKMQTAKTDYERNEIIKESEKALKEMKEIMGYGDLAEGKDGVNQTATG
jgi:hypothetical protein